MKAIIGLGNPGKPYAANRHNAGAIFIQWLIKEKLKVQSTTNANKYMLYTVRDDLLLCIPTTYMNLSGKAVQALNRKFPTLTNKDILVVHDDLEHKIGNVRIKEGGSSQGHNGVESIIQELKTNAFKRLQLGISRPQSRDPEVVAKYVLTNFGKDELSKFQNSFSKAMQIAKQHKFL